jgi:hypothetical protein
MGKFKEISIENPHYVILESVMPSLRGKMENTPGTGDIALSATVRDYVERMGEAVAWELASSKFDYVSTNAEKFIEMIIWLNVRNQSVGISHDYLMTDPKRVFIENSSFSSETIYGALAKCVLYKEFACEVARIERKHPPVMWTKHSARIGRML